MRVPVAERNRAPDINLSQQAWILLDQRTPEQRQSLVYFREAESVSAELTFHLEPVFPKLFLDHIPGKKK